MTDNKKTKEEKIPKSLPKYLQNIWKILIWRNIPQKALTEPLGKSQPEVNRLLRYKREMKVDELYKIADFLKIQPDVLIFDLPTKEYFIETADVINWFYTLKDDERTTVLKYGLLQFKMLQEELKNIPFLLPRRFQPKK